MRPHPVSSGMETSLADLLLRLPGWGRRPALVLRGRYRSVRLTYRELHDAVLGFATALQRSGVVAGDRVLLRGPDGPAWVAALLGCVRLGAVAVPLDAGGSDAFARAVRDRTGARAAILPVDDHWKPGVPVIALAIHPPGGEIPPPHRASPGDVLQIVFTSGTTGEPRGVTITHGNLLAYLQPIERGYLRRRWYVRPFLPVRLLCLPPLSHLFGQAVGIFVPLMLGCTVVFLESREIAGIRRALRQERIVLAMVVPRLLEMLAERLRADAVRRGWDLERLRLAGRDRGLPARAVRAWRVQLRLGLRFRGFVVGGAPLDPELERFWRDLGYVIVQGYGLTETAPVITLTHPFRGRPGTVGRPLRGMEVRLADDGEILVRGGNVMAGYWDDPQATRLVLDPDGFLHTGDLARRDPDGTLRIVGRKREIIVPAHGRNVHPEDVERALRRQRGVRDSVVVGLAGSRGEEVHAVLLLAPDASPEEAVAAANREMEPDQRVASFTVWPNADLPRTPTGKPRRREVAAAAARMRGAGEHRAPSDPLTAILVRAGADAGRIDESRGLADLGLGSLDLVEVATEIEATFGVDVPDGALAAGASVGDLRRLAAGGAPGDPAALELPPPRWARRLPVRWLRRLGRDGIVLPLLAPWVRLEIQGTEHLAEIEPPALLVANHVSLLDVPVLCRALPVAWRRRTAPAMTAEYFRAWLRPEESTARLRYLRGLQLFLATALFQVFLLPRGQGFRRSLHYAGELLDAGQCPMVFPEGRRFVDGMREFQAGIGLMAVRLGAAVVPLHHRGLESVLPPEARWPTRGAVTVRIGAPLRFSADADPAAVAGEIEAAVRSLSGTTGGPEGRTGTIAPRNEGGDR